MKKILLLLFIFTNVAVTSFAQLGKMQYQDAEEQFANGKFKDALELLDASEKSSGRSNPLIEHLRILARTELLKQDVEANIEHLETARNEVQRFLSKYDGDTRLEDKYREVYLASKTLASFPTRAAIEQKRAQEEKLEEEKKRAAELSFLPNYRDGMTVEELKAAIPGYLSELNLDSMRMLMFSSHKITVLVSKKTGRSYGYTIIDKVNPDLMCKECIAKYESKIATVTEKFGLPVTRSGDPETIKVQLAGTSTLTRSSMISTWQRDTKIIALIFSCVTQKKNSTGEIVLSSIDTAFQ